MDGYWAWRDKPGMQTMLEAFLEAALWAATAEDGNPLDREHTVSDFSSGARARAATTCEAFLASCEATGVSEGVDSAQGGHDLWLTIQRHGCGFWETPDWPAAQQ